MEIWFFLTAGAEYAAFYILALWLVTRTARLHTARLVGTVVVAATVYVLGFHELLIGWAALWVCCRLSGDGDNEENGQTAERRDSIAFRVLAGLAVSILLAGEIMRQESGVFLRPVEPWESVVRLFEYSLPFWRLGGPVLLIGCIVTLFRLSTPPKRMREAAA